MLKLHRARLRSVTRAQPTEWAIWPIVIHSLRTAIVAIASLLVARLCRLPQAYWAAITTVVIAQSSLGAAESVSWQRFIGTFLGAVVGGIGATYYGPHWVTFGASVFLLGLVCAAVRCDFSAFRFGAMTVAIVVLIPGTAPAWRIAFNRFAEVSIGIVVALLFTWLWAEIEIKPPSTS